MGNFIRVHLPEIEPIFLVSSYAAPLVAHHDPPFQYVIWSHEIDTLRGYDAIIHVFPRNSIAWAALRAKIPRRVGTSRRWYHWLTCTHRPSVSRRFSGKHEAALNLALLAPLLPSELRPAVQNMTWQDVLPYRARLRPIAALPAFIAQAMDSDRLPIILHVGSAGGSPLWKHWQSLALLLIARFPHALLIFTGGPHEKPFIQAITDNLPEGASLDTAGKLSLDELITLIAQTALLIAGSTGPLHIAAALDTPCIGLFPATPEMGPWRWRPLTASASVLYTEVSCSKCSPTNCHCLVLIQPAQVIEQVEMILSHHLTAPKDLPS